MAAQDTLIIGVDSGGTKTIAGAATIDGRFVGIGYGGATNTHFVSDKDAIASMRGAVAQALGQSAQDPTPVPAVKAIYISAPGFPDQVAEMALRDLCPKAVIKVEGDAPAAFRGALPRGDGIVVLSGTGSFAAGLWQGKWLTNGGWGPLLGDEGSGYWIGLEALKAVALAADNRGPKTSLQEIFRRALHYSFDEELRVFIYSKSVTRQRISALTTLVAQAAREGDAIAQDILRRAGIELAKLAVNLAERLQIDSAPVNISLVGGVPLSNPPVVQSFKEYIAQMIPQANYVAPQYEPWIGAVLLAYELAELEVTSDQVQAIGENAAALLKAQ